MIARLRARLRYRRFLRMCCPRCGRRYHSGDVCRVDGPMPTSIRAHIDGERGQALPLALLVLLVVTAASLAVYTQAHGAAKASELASTRQETEASVEGGLAVAVESARQYGGVSVSGTTTIGRVPVTWTGSRDVSGDFWNLRASSGPLWMSESVETRTWETFAFSEGP